MHCHSSRWLVLYMRRRLLLVPHMSHPHHGSAPSFFAPPRSTTRTRTPFWWSRTGLLWPVDCFQELHSPVALAIILFMFGGIASGSFLAPENMVDMLNLGMPDAGFGMLSASSMQDLVCGLHLVCRIGIWVASCMRDFLLWSCEFTPTQELNFFCEGFPHLYIYFFFCKFERAILALFSQVFFWILCFLTLDTELGHNFIIWLSSVVDMLARWFAPWAGSRTWERRAGQKFHYLQLVVGVT